MKKFYLCLDENLPTKMWMIGSNTLNALHGNPSNFTLRGNYLEKGFLAASPRCKKNVQSSLPKKKFDIFFNFFLNYMKNNGMFFFLKKNFLQGVNVLKMSLPHSFRNRLRQKIGGDCLKNPCKSFFLKRFMVKFRTGQLLST